MDAQKTESILEHSIKIDFFMDSNIDTDFSYIGMRNYINSASLVEFIYDNVNIFIDGALGKCFLDIKMHKEISTNCRVDFYSNSHEYNDEEVMCECILKSDNNIRVIYFLSNNNSIRKNIDDSVYHVKEVSSYGEFSGQYSINSSNYNEFIKNIIQSNKEIHLKSFNSVKFKILNIFMKNIPIGLHKYINTLDIEIKNIGIRDAVDSGFSTLNEVSFFGVNVQPVLIGFQVVRLNQ